MGRSISLPARTRSASSPATRTATLSVPTGARPGLYEGQILITLTGVCRFEVVEELPTPTPYRQVRAGYDLFACDLEPAEEPLEFERPPFLALLRRYLDQRGLGIEWDAVTTAPAGALVNSLSMALPFDTAEKQALLEIPSIEERRAALTALLEIDSAETDDDDEPPPLQ